MKNVHSKILFFLALSIPGLLISQSNDILWNYSLPIGNEAYKIIKLANLFQLTIHDFQIFQDRIQLD